MKTKWKVTSSVATFLLTTLLFLGSFAGIANAVSAGPNEFEITANPGDEIVKTMYLTNNEALPLYLTVAIQDFIIDPVSGNKQYVDVAPQQGCKDWVTLDYSEQLADPDEPKNFNLTIKIPKDAVLGKYSATIFSSSKTMPKEGSAPLIGVVGRIASDLNITVTDAEVVNAQPEVIQPQVQEKPITVWGMSLWQALIIIALIAIISVGTYLKAKK